MANAIVIGFETESHDKDYWSEVEGAFLLIFTCELFFRLCVTGLCDFLDICEGEEVYTILYYTIL